LSIDFGTGGANPCVAVVIKCDDVVYVYHYAGPNRPASYPDIKNQSNCSAVVCGGSKDDDRYGRSSRCLKRALIDSLKKQGIKIDGVFSDSACGWSNIEGNEGWYHGY